MELYHNHFIANPNASFNLMLAERLLGLKNENTCQLILLLLADNQEKNANIIRYRAMDSLKKRGLKTIDSLQMAANADKDVAVMTCKELQKFFANSDSASSIPFPKIYIYEQMVLEKEPVIFETDDSELFKRSIEHYHAWADYSRLTLSRTVANMANIDQLLPKIQPKNEPQAQFTVKDNNNNDLESQISVEQSQIQKNQEELSRIKQENQALNTSLYEATKTNSDLKTHVTQSI